MPKMKIRVELPSQYAGITPLSYRKRLAGGFAKKYRIDHPKVIFSKEQPLFESHNTLIAYKLYGDENE